MDLNHPIESVIPSAHGPVLAALAATEAPLTGRGVAALLDGRVSSRRVADVLSELAAAGIVLRSRAGAAYQFRLNREHLATPSIVALAGLRAALMDAITEQVLGWVQPAVAVWLFGSAARGVAGPTSDIDLLVIRPSSVADVDAGWLEQISELDEQVRRWTGNETAILEYGEDEFTTLVEADDRLVDSLRADAIVLAGETVQQRSRAGSI